VTGQTVVYKTMVSVVVEPILAGQSVTVAAQEVIVYTEVVYAVDVVYWVVVISEVVELIAAVVEVLETFQFLLDVGV